MRPALFLVLPLVLAACATPRESCLSSVGQQGRVIDALISQTRGNVARGYAIVRDREDRPVTDPAALDAGAVLSLEFAGGKRIGAIATTGSEDGATGAFGSRKRRKKSAPQEREQGDLF